MLNRLNTRIRRAWTDMLLLHACMLGFSRRPSLQTAASHAAIATRAAKQAHFACIFSALK